DTTDHAMPVDSSFDRPADAAIDLDLPTTDISLDSDLPAPDTSISQDAPSADLLAAADIPVAGCVTLGEAPTQPLGGISQSVAAAGSLVIIGASDTVTDGVTLYTRSGSSLTQEGTFSTSIGLGALNGTDNEVVGTYLRNDRAYLATYYGGVVVLDVSNPASPSFVAGLHIINETWAVQATDTHIFATNTGLGLVVLQVQGENLVQLTTLPLAGAPHDLHIVGDQLFVATYSHVHEVDISTPDAPQLVRSVDTFTHAYELWSGDGRYIYVVEKMNARLVVLDMSATPGDEQVAVFDTGTAARCVDGAGNHLVVGTDDRLLSYDLSIPEAPAPLDGPTTNQSTYEVALIDGVVIAGLRDGTVQMGEVQACP
ncbi:MAG: hypothetical protein JRH20_22905, partial [Deltaproteobacteria bacterium]|nr:hypothetical protein [Deltaproteobacteria bacterium]